MSLGQVLFQPTSWHPKISPSQRFPNNGAIKECSHLQSISSCQSSDWRLTARKINAASEFIFGGSTMENFKRQNPLYLLSKLFLLYMSSLVLLFRCTTSRIIRFARPAIGTYLKVVSLYDSVYNYEILENMCNLLFIPLIHS